MKDLIAGMDEVGMGCLAGPLVVGVAMFNDDKPIPGVTDSKKISKTKMGRLVNPILERAYFFNFGWAYPKDIDEKGIAVAWQNAATLALKGAPTPRVLMVDGIREVESVGSKYRQETHIKGDLNFWQIGAASILAKVFRDMEMKWYHQHYPQYGWDTNAGYGSAVHKGALLEHGPTPIHRKTFIKKIIGGPS